MAQTGDIPLNDLARVGQRFLKEPPDSGTATREMVNYGLGVLGAADAARLAFYSNNLLRAAQNPGAFPIRVA